MNLEQGLSVLINYPRTQKVCTLGGSHRYSEVPIGIRLPREFHRRAAQSSPIVVSIEEALNVIATMIDTGRME